MAGATPQAKGEALSGREPAGREVYPALAVGAILVALTWPTTSSMVPYVAMLAGIICGAVPRVREVIGRGLDRLRHPSWKVKAVVAIVLFALSARYFLLSASLAGRDLYPKMHDEFMYLLQARILSRGRLWMPPHPLGEVFESFNVIVRPVYGATYFPGTALLYVPGTWLGLAPWATSVAIAGLCVALTYLVIESLIDGVAGVLAALLLVSLEQFRTLAVATMSHSAMLLLWLGGIGAMLCWRRSRHAGWAAAVGALAGWAAITRPLDALCAFAPIGAVMAWDLRRQPAARWAATAGALVVAAAPFLALQAVFDKGVTGHVLETPFAAYSRANFPGLGFGFGHRAAAPAAATGASNAALPQVRDYYEQFLRHDLRTHGDEGFLRTWLAGRLLAAADVSLPSRWLFLLLPLGAVAAVRSATRLAVAVPILLLSLAYALYPSYLRHYGLVLAPAFLLLALTGAESIRARFGRAAGVGMSVGLLVLALGSLPEVRGARDHFMETPYLADVNAKLANLEHTPAVVLFKYSRQTDVHEEPVFNLDVAWPDDAPVIRAQDLGEEKDREVFAYYAGKTPERYFYRYDRRTGELTPLGWARELATGSGGW